MFFALSKTLGIMLLPINFLIELGLLGLLCLLLRWRRLGRGLMVTSILLLAIAGFTPAGNLLMYPLEQRFPPWDASRGAPDGIVVLGGGIDPDPSAVHGEAAFTSSGGRLISAASSRAVIRTRASSIPAAAPISLATPRPRKPTSP